MSVFAQGEVELYSLSACLVYWYIRVFEYHFRLILNPSIQGESFIFSNIV